MTVIAGFIVAEKNGRILGSGASADAACNDALRELASGRHEISPLPEVQTYPATATLLQHARKFPDKTPWVLRFGIADLEESSPSGEVWSVLTFRTNNTMAGVMRLNEETAKSLYRAHCCDPTVRRVELHHDTTFVRACDVNVTLADRIYVMRRALEQCAGTIDKLDFEGVEPVDGYDIADVIDLLRGDLMPRRPWEDV